MGKIKKKRNKKSCSLRRAHIMTKAVALAQVGSDDCKIVNMDRNKAITPTQNLADYFTVFRIDGLFCFACSALSATRKRK